jgi:alcohol dehydrogenase (cytochrome c)
MRTLARIATLVGLALLPAGAQSIDPKQLLSPPTDAWLTYHGEYNGQRHSKLTQITPENVSQIRQAWHYQASQGLKASPIVANGIIYITAPDNLWAVDARTGKELWHHQHAKNDAFHIGHRGAAIYKNTVYLSTPDCHLMAMDARNGEVKWDVLIADSTKGYWSTNAPLVIGNHVIVGVSGDFDNLPGLLSSFDADTGKRQWSFYSTPPPGESEPKSGGATGGQMWNTGTYDPQLNLMFVGTGNPTPVLNGGARPGDNPWTCSIVALNPDTGKLAWGFQVSPHDTHDWDAAEVPVLVDGDFNGQPRKMLLQASRNGYFFVLDRATGKSLLTKPFASVNWSKGIDEQGRPIPNAAKEPSRDGVLVSPDESGATNFYPPSFDPQTGFLIVNAKDAYGIYFYKNEHGAYGWAGADYGLASRGFLRAIDFKTGKIAWEHPYPRGGSSAGVLTTQTGLAITGDGADNVMAFRTSDGTALWHENIGKVSGAPVTYELDGKQYLLVSGGNTLFAYSLQ